MKAILLFLLLTQSALAGYTELVHSAEVSASEDSTVTFTPAAGEEVILEHFIGNATETPETTVFVVWDYGGGGETVKWSTHGSVDEDPSFVIGVGDGVKQVGLCLKNEDSVARILSGKALFKRAK